MAEKQKWSVESVSDGSYSPDKFYTSGTDDKGHRERVRDVTVPPWLFDVMHRLAHEIPAFKGQIGTLCRDAFAHRVHDLIEMVEDPKARDELEREFRLHMDIEEQSWLMKRYAEMQKYVTTTRVTLAVLHESKNWMLISSQIEKMRKRLLDGLLWEPCSTEIQELIDEYVKKLKNAGQK